MCHSISIVERLKKESSWKVYDYDGDEKEFFWLIHKVNYLENNTDVKKGNQKNVQMLPLKKGAKSTKNELFLEKSSKKAFCIF